MVTSQMECQKRIYVAVDIKTKKIISLEVTSEEVHDGKVLKKLTDADGMYDSNNNFLYLLKNHIKPGIKTKGNSKVNSINCC